MTSLNDLFKRQPEKMFVNQVISGSIFMAEEESRPIKIKDMDELFSDKDKLQDLIWSRNVMVTKLYEDENKCIVSEVSLNNKPLTQLLAS